jgi:hypothetical protein
MITDIKNNYYLNTITIMKNINKQPPTFAAILQFWQRPRTYYEISTNFNLDLYLKYLKAINEYKRNN